MNEDGPEWDAWKAERIERHAIQQSAPLPEPGQPSRLHEQDDVLAVDRAMADHDGAALAVLLLISAGDRFTVLGLHPVLGPLLERERAIYQELRGQVSFSTAARVARVVVLRKLLQLFPATQDIR